MVEITNTSTGLRGVNTTDQGTVYLQPGQTLDLNVSEAEMKVIERTAKPPNASGLFVGTRQEAVDADAMAADAGDMVDPATYEDASTTDVPNVARPIHPAPLGADLSQGDVPAEEEVISTPWEGNASAPQDPNASGEGATTEGGDTTARRSKVRT